MSDLDWIDRATVILDSYRRLLGKDLFTRTGDAAGDARRLDDLPVAVLAHDGATPPLLDWVNRAAAAAFDATPADLIGLPSTATAPADAAADRQELFVRLRDRGFVTGYSGVRVSLRGRRFMIEDVTVYELRDRDGRAAGHAAIIGTTRPELAR